MASVTIIFGTGWGRAGWNQGAWNQGGIATLSMAGTTGSESVVEGTGVTVSETGILAQYSFGTYSVGEGTGVTIVESGVAGAFSIGTGYVVKASSVLSPTGIEGNLALGVPNIQGGVTVSVTGVTCASAIGSESVVEGTGVTVIETGITADSAIGTVAVTQMAVGVTGIEIASTVNSAVIWQPIVPSQTPNWVEIGNRDAA